MGIYLREVKADALLFPAGRPEVTVHGAHPRSSRLVRQRGSVRETGPNRRTGAKPHRSSWPVLYPFAPTRARSFWRCPSRLARLPCKAASRRGPTCRPPSLTLLRACTIPSHPSRAMSRLPSWTGWIHVWAGTAPAWRCWERVTMCSCSHARPQRVRAWRLRLANPAIGASFGKVRCRFFRMRAAPWSRLAWWKESARARSSRLIADTSLPELMCEFYSSAPLKGDHVYLERSFRRRNQEGVSSLCPLLTRRLARAGSSAKPSAHSGTGRRWEGRRAMPPTTLRTRQTTAG